MARLIEMDDFINRLQAEGPIVPYSWLIGAGMSVSAGIPLARTVSELIILFQYIMTELKKRPWDHENLSRITYAKDLTEFFNWYDTQDKDFPTLLMDSITWIGQIDGFENISPKDTRCYSLLFEKVLLSNISSRQFLTTLVNRVKGVNLAHLALAGIMRDYPEWGHTVFTTNFDDLLLKAILTLNHTCRIFGEFDSKDQPSDRPTYTQIVHLHGRHTGYRLINTEKAQANVNLNNPELLSSFLSQLNNSHLIVLGYSGWDDLVMKTLKNWPKERNLLRGSLIWVPYMSEDSILPETREFLDSCPSDRVFIVVNSKKPLDADRFMVAIADALNEESNGFVSYREGVIVNAEAQHSFLFEQLKMFPEHDPYHVLIEIEEIWDKLKQKDLHEVRVRIKKAHQKINYDDIPFTLKAKSLLEIGRIYLVMGDYPISRQCLIESLALWSRDRAEIQEEAIQEKANVLRALAELSLIEGKLEEGLTHCLRALNRYRRVGDTNGVGFISRIMSEISAKEGKLKKAMNLAVQSYNAFEESANNYGLGISLFAQGQISILTKNIKDASKFLEESLGFFDAVCPTKYQGKICLYLAHIKMAECLYEEGWQLAQQSLEFFHLNNDSLGLANFESFCGDFFFSSKDFEKSLVHYIEAESHYRDLGLKHGITNSLADQILVYRERPFDEDNMLLNIENLKTELSICENPYALRILKDTLLFIKDKQEGGQSE